MSRRRSVFLLMSLLACPVISGCMGTWDNRFKAGDPIGAYPFQAIASDVTWMAASFRNLEGSRWIGAPVFLVCFLSLPFDTLIDVVMCPVDTVGWLCGCRKEALDADKYQVVPEVPP